MPVDQIQAQRNTTLKKRPNSLIEEDLRESLSLSGKETLTTHRYMQFRRAGALTRDGVLVRYGSWQKACAAAGVEPGPCRRASYSRAWNDDELLFWAEQYMASPGALGSYGDFERWCVTQPTAPSASTVRNRLGNWNEIKLRFM